MNDPAYPGPYTVPGALRNVYSVAAPPMPPPSDARTTGHTPVYDDGCRVVFDYGRAGSCYRGDLRQPWERITTFWNELRGPYP